MAEDALEAEKSNVFDFTPSIRFEDINPTRYDIYAQKNGEKQFPFRRAYREELLELGRDKSKTYEQKRDRVIEMAESQRNRGDNDGTADVICYGMKKIAEDEIVPSQPDFPMPPINDENRKEIQARMARGVNEIVKMMNLDPEFVKAHILKQPFPQSVK